jgi:multidrug resistance efflux pump
MDLNKLQRKVKLARASVKKNQATLKTLDKDSPRYNKCKASIKAAQTRLANAKAELAAAKPKSKVSQMASKVAEKLHLKSIGLKTGTIIATGITLGLGAWGYMKFNNPSEEAQPGSKDTMAA